jgi:hypothetical protein
MANGTTKGKTGTVGSACIRTDYKDVDYIDGDNEVID